ncbi:MAG: TonB-dependent receptor [Pseudomonadales bacterium]|nr:TonB-dependent receptor [Pseudomonadales bacterium]
MNHFLRATALSILFASAVASAETTLPEVVVTASLRQDSTMDTAASVSVVSEEVIRARAAQHFEDIINTIPNVNYASGSNRARFFQIRGIGERSQFVNPINPSVGVLIDDVDFSGAGTIATLMDVQQVEVLRGPQGTRYGANALAGLINVTTNEPDDSRFAEFKLMAGEYSTETFGMVLNAPVNADFKTRLVVESHESDGYIENDFLGRDDTNGRDEMTIRGKLNWQVSDDWSLGLTVADVNIDNGYDAFSLDNTRHTLSDEPGFDRQDSTYFSLRSDWNLERFDVTALLNQSESDSEYGYDEDWSFTGIHPWGYTSTDHYFRERETTSAEIRLLSNDRSRLFNDTTDWVLGLYYLASDETLERQYTFDAGPFFSDYDFDTLAVFTQLDAALSNSTTLTLGLRLEERDTTYDDSEGVVFSPHDSMWGGKLAIENRLESDALIYASVSRGYKAGGFNTDGSLDADLRTFDEEYLIEYELGYKAMLAGGALGLQVAVFYDDRHDQQVKSSLVRTRPDGSTEFIDFLGNAAEGTNRGLEIDMSWTLSERFFLTANVGWLDAEFDEFTNEFGEDLSGRDQAHAPGYMFNVALSYEQGPWFASLSVDGKDEFYFSDRHALKSDSYTLFNASMGYTADQWTVTLWGRNLADEDYYVRGFGSFGNDPRKFYVTEPYYQFGEPRITGLTFEFRLGDS